MNRGNLDSAPGAPRSENDNPLRTLNAYFAPQLVAVAKIKNLEEGDAHLLSEVETNQAVIKLEDHRAAIEELRLTLNENLAAIVGEWRRQKHLFPELERDGWMDLKLKIFANFVESLQQERNDVTGPTDEVNRFRSGISWPPEARRGRR